MNRKGFLSSFSISIMLLFIFSFHTNSLAADGEPLLDFFSALYKSSKTDFIADYKDDYVDFCKKYNVDHDNLENQEEYFKLLFFHKVLTGTNSYDCAKGGMLDIPYMWHWITPNPRHKIIDNLTGKPLIDKRPPKAFANYKSHADIDRTPSIYLLDLVSEDAKYRHPDCGEFYTFGWCSEREMTFSLLMSLYGYKSKIIQEAIHVTSDFWVEFLDKSKKAITLIAKVDNTYDLINWKREKKLAFDSWYNDTGKIKMEKWYNKKARSTKEKERVRGILVTEKAAARIEGMVQ
ncbi:hypothetical protein ACFL2A_04275 [Thermodesulfobacteriota bacterium]